MSHHGSLRRSTAAGMWAAYSAHTALVTWSLGRQPARLRIPARPAQVAGAAISAAGFGLCIAGMRRFAGVEELTGTRNQALLTAGVYRFSRNPQYLGYLAALAGAGLSRRSGAALLSTAVLAFAYSAWIPVEEQHMSRLYGRDYSDYCRRTRRWWGRRG
ncbi:phosphatidylethanolamine N-methyltransferase family protein [Nocardioidaceae bacterium]|nr:phosphatidylethanolamine N-methyltransferase family protein [Nocardioidaceae bacterium]